MNTNQIVLTGVNLHYAAVAFKERSLKSLLSRFRYPCYNKAEITDIHALKNIDLSIKPGERVALIGHNGAGKSTLLKTIAGLYPISSGKLTVRGDIRALFDFSLGFEPDATGRENILYRGLLLGLTPKYIRARQAEIIEFAGLNEFIDYPIKTYSAGMQVRLAFAISTAVGGDILLLDEMIGAGDASFMVQARQRILNLIERAEILLLASHDFAALRDLCNRALVFHHGAIVFDGSVKAAISKYNEIHGALA